MEDQYFEAELTQSDTNWLFRMGGPEARILFDANLNLNSALLKYELQMLDAILA